MRWTALVGHAVPRYPRCGSDNKKRGAAVTFTIRTVVSLVVVGLVGCAGTTNQVVPTGHDTYMVANHGTMGWSSAGAQKAKAYEEANAFCKSKGKEVETVNEHETDSGFGKIASADIEFRCVAPK
jgi:hypothetical protein